MAKKPRQKMNHLGEIGISIKQFLPSLTITDDQLMLATTNGHQRVNGIDNSLHGIMLSRDNTVSLDTDTGTVR